MKSKIINIIAGPGAGKSTTAAGVFYELKMLRLNAEISSEYAKDLVYEDRKSTFKDELYIFAKQAHRLFRLKDKVEYIVTDRPLIMSIIYNEFYNNDSANKSWNEALSNMAMETWKKYDNIVYFLKRVKPYIQDGRNESEEQAMMLDKLFRDKLIEYGIEFKEINGDETAVEAIMKDLGLRD